MEGWNMRHIRGFFLGRNGSLVDRLRPDEEKAVFDDSRRQLVLRLYRCRRDQYILTVVARFQAADSEVELQYDSGSIRQAESPIAQSARYIADRGEEAEYLFRLARRYLEGENPPGSAI